MSHLCPAYENKEISDMFRFSIVSAEDQQPE